MKIAITLVLLALSTSPALAGNWFGPGPFANGAYFPGQYDGVYSATMFGGAPAVISGVLGFGLRNGAPSTVDNSTITTGGTETTISVDPFQNYFVVFLNGQTYAGLTIANLNNQVDQVSGGLFNGVGPSTVTPVAVANPAPPPATIATLVTNQNTAGGGFIASLTGKKAVITFSGNNTGTLQTSVNGVPVPPANTFSLNGMKVGNQTAQASATTR
jgi:hypothetical protein